MSRISLMLQEGSLRSYFPGSEIKRKGEHELTWIYTVTPSPFSATYKLKLHYKKNEGADIFVIDPQPLELAPGTIKLPHVYSTPKQELCLWYPKWREWSVEMFYVKTLIPWACEWLWHYEIWVGTGEWKGGGIAHETEAEKQADLQKEEINEAISNKKK